jgi:amidohydrolase
LKLSDFRKELHSHPELSGKETETAQRIKAELKKYKLAKIIDKLGGNGIAAFFEGKNPGKTILFRAELDALPIQETNTFDYASKTKNVSHKCGHDGHMTILVGLAKNLSENPPEKGTAVLLFQPAEETGAGAKAVLEEPKFKEIKPDFLFALHNIPGQEKGKIICKKGSFTPAVSSIVIKLEGKTSHAAEPENGINPDLAIAELVSTIKKMEKPDEGSQDFAVIATVYANLGSKDYGISAGEGEVHFTVRCWTSEQLDYLKKEIKKAVKSISKKHKLQASTEWIYDFAANDNDSEAFSLIKKAADENGFDFIEKKHPFKWGEDFGLFTQKHKGAMFGLGSGENTPALHNPDYDFPDEIITFGVKMFRKIFDLSQK